jgi:uncharacterized membrane protein YfcA
MDFLTITLPYANIDVFIPTLIFIGFCVGLISAFLGIGGAWIVTPALNALGFPMTYAIGTDIAHIGGKGLLATLYHSRRKNVDYPMALFMLIGTVYGLEAGAQTVMLLEKMDQVESILRWTYILLLFFISLFFLVQKKQGDSDWPKKFHSILPRPFFYFKASNIRCSIWLPILIGLFTGYAAGFLGIGGGLLRLPLLIYCVGCPVLVAVGTDLFEVMLSGFYGGISYALKGRVDYLAALLMFLGAILGTKMGVITACRVKEQHIKDRFGLAVLGCLISVVLKQMNYPVLSKIAIFTTLIFLVVSILFLFFRGSVIDASFRKARE